MQAWFLTLLVTALFCGAVWCATYAKVTLWPRADAQQPEPHERRRGMLALAGALASFAAFFTLLWVY